jgi:signal transduction histidine kinase
VHQGSSVPAAEEIEKVLGLLIHDIRTPLGVAMGYVRLLKDARLATPEERERALTRTIAALGSIWRLCEEADGFLAPHFKSSPGIIRATALVERVFTRIGPSRVQRASGEAGDHLFLRTTAGADQLADAIETAAAKLGRLRDDDRVMLTVEASASELRVIAEDRARAGQPVPMMTPVDPWQSGHGLGLPLACHVIGCASGRVLTSADPPGRVLITFPLESLVS